MSIVINRGDGGLLIDPPCERCGRTQVREVLYSSAGQPLLPTEIESLAWTDYLCVCGSVRLRLGKNPNS
ncbi:MAG: hypothetical protein MK127_04595 [Dehalococcoidia bacterium]|nr:hypothetical protein [Dehalococcoidia bacterium]